ncbi:MAG: hypothetical protein AB1295_05050 [Candidatus Micrarchaeota archaeon]
MKVLVFGNPMVEEDSIALRLMPLLRERFPGVEFKEFDPTENLEGEGRDLIILDAAKGIGKAVLLEGTSSLERSGTYSLHDYDLPISLSLLKRLGKIDSVRLIAVPSSSSLDEALEQSAAIISSLLSGNASRSSCKGHKRG